MTLHHFSVFVNYKLYLPGYMCIWSFMDIKYSLLKKTTNTIYFANITTRVGHIGSWSGIHSKHEVIWKAEYIYYVLNPKQGLNVQFTTCICVQDTQYVKDVLVPIGCGITGALLIVIVAYLWRNYWCRPKHTQQTPKVSVKVSVASWELPKKPGRNNSLTSL